MPESRTTFIPAQEQPDEFGTNHSWDHRLYRNQVQAGSVWDGSLGSSAFRYAVATAKDKARNRLIKAVRTEAKRIQSESYTTLGLDYLTRDRDIASFDAQARNNVLVQRSVDGVVDAPDDAIKL